MSLFPSTHVAASISGLLPSSGPTASSFAATHVAAIGGGVFLPPGTPATYFPVAQVAAAFGGILPLVTVTSSFFEQDLVAYLRTLGLTVYPGRIPQRVPLPAITFFQVFGAQGTKLSGASGVAEGRYQIGVSGYHFEDVGPIVVQLRKDLFRVQYQLGPTRVFSAVLGPQVTRYDPPKSSNDKGVHTKISEFAFQYQDTIPS